MGKDVLEICGLCRQYKKLERSHLLSKALVVSEVLRTFVSDGLLFLR